MPTEAAVERERRVVQVVIDALASATGMQVELIGSPDEERGSGRFPATLTVDAVIRLANQMEQGPWAIDVMNVPWDNRLIPAIRGFEERLRRELQAVVVRAGIGVTVLYQPPVDHLDRGEAYLEQIIEYTQCLISGASVSGHPIEGDPDTQIEIQFDRTRPSQVLILTSLSGTKGLREQLALALVPPLRKKLAGQLRNAHDLGYPTILVLDRVGPPSSVGNNFLASHAAVGQVISQAVASFEHRGGAHSLDLAVVVDEQSCSPVYGYWPTDPAP